MKKVVIVGGGIAGKKLVESLEKNKSAELTLVEPKEYLEGPFAQLRALVEPEDFSPSIRKKYSTLLPGVQHIMKKAAGIQGKKLSLEDGTEIEFDYLVIASGSSYMNWPYLKSSEATMEARQVEVQKEGAKLDKADSVLIIGGGAVGVELAGEIAYKWRDKKVTIANGSPRILNALSEKMTARSEKLLKGLGVKIQNNTRLTNNPDGSWKDESGKSYSADIIYQAVGISINSEWLDKSGIEMTERGAVMVEADLRIKGSESIFALGDINDVPELNLGAFAGRQADFAVKNINSLIENPSAELKSYKPSKPLSMIPVGKKSGVVQLPFGHPHFLIALKQKDLFASQVLK